MPVSRYLHGGIIHNHVVKNNIWISCCYLLTALQEETIAQLPIQSTAKTKRTSRSKPIKHPVYETGIDSIYA